MYALVLNILGIFMFSNFFLKKVTSIHWLLTKMLFGNRSVLHGRDQIQDS